MTEITDDRDGEFAMARVPGRTYVCRCFAYAGFGPGDPLDGVAARFGYTVLDQTGDAEFSSDGGWELVLRDTPTRQQLKVTRLPFRSAPGSLG